MANAQQQPLEYSTLMDALRQYEASTAFETQDLTQAEYKRDSEFGSLSFGTEKYELNEWSARQLCRTTHVPFGAWRKCSEGLASDFFKEFVPAIKEPQVKMAIKHRGKATTKTLRGILPLDYPDIRNSDVLGALEKITEPFSVEAAPWTDSANPSMLRTRVVFDRLESEVNTDKVKLGLDITVSELGDGPFQINLLLFRQVCSNGAIATYGRRPYFHFDYSGTLAFNIDDLMGAAMGRISTDAVRYIDAVEVAQRTPCTLAQAQSTIQNMVDKGALNKGISLKVLATLEKDGCNQLWDVVNAVTAQARGFRDDLRLRYERAGGLLLGLCFDRNQGEEDFAKTATEVRDEVYTKPATLLLHP